MPTLSFTNWVRETAPPNYLTTSGLSVYEYGARATFGCADYGSIYDRRGVMVKEERAGRVNAAFTISNTDIVVLCDCCGQPFKAFVDRDG